MCHTFLFLHMSSNFAFNHIHFKVKIIETMNSVVFLLTELTLWTSRKLTCLNSSSTLWFPCVGLQSKLFFTSFSLNWSARSLPPRLCNAKVHSYIQRRKNNLYPEFRAFQFWISAFQGFSPHLLAVVALNSVLWLDFHPVLATLRGDN